MTKISNEVSIHPRSQLRVYDEEDVPGVKNFHERFLSLGKQATFIKGNRK